MIKRSVGCLAAGEERKEEGRNGRKGRKGITKEHKLTFGQSRYVHYVDVMGLQLYATHQMYTFKIYSLFMSVILQ